MGKVKKGDFGGLIQKEQNLSHDGNCWVFDHAQVSGDAQISGRASVSGYAKVDYDVKDQKITE